MAAMNSSVLSFNYSAVVASSSSSELTSKLSPMLLIPSPVSTSTFRSQHMTRVSDSNITIANNNNGTRIRRRSTLLALASLLFTSVTTYTTTAYAGIIDDYIGKNKANKELFDKKSKFPENFTRCQDLDKQKVLLSLSREVRSVAAFEMRLTVPDQTPEEADAIVKSDSDSLIMSVKTLTNMPALKLKKETQKMMRKSAAVLKQDLYTIIQGRPGGERPELRRLYTVLFNGITYLDYAARDNDVVGVKQFSDLVVTTLNEILSRIL